MAVAIYVFYKKRSEVKSNKVLGSTENTGFKNIGDKSSNVIAILLLLSIVLIISFSSFFQDLSLTNQGLSAATGSVSIITLLALIFGVLGYKTNKTLSIVIMVAAVLLFTYSLFIGFSHVHIG